MSPDEWLRKLEAESHPDDEDESALAHNGLDSRHQNNSKRGKKKNKKGVGVGQGGNEEANIQGIS